MKERPIEKDQKEANQVQVRLNTDEWPMQVIHNGKMKREVPFGKIEGIIYLLRHGGFTHFQG